MPTAIKFTPVNIEERKNLDIRVGDTVRIYMKVEEKGKTRLQPYEGTVIAHKHGREPGATITVRKVASGVGMEKIIPIYSPNVGKVEIVKRAKVRRSKLYYIREKAAKEARKKMKQEMGFEKMVAMDEAKQKAEEERAENEELVAESGERETETEVEQSDPPAGEAGIPSEGGKAEQTKEEA